MVFFLLFSASVSQNDTDFSFDNDCKYNINKNLFLVKVI